VRNSKSIFEKVMNLINLMEGMKFITKIYILVILNPNKESLIN